MTVFVHTSAFLAVLNRDDRFHELADVSWRALVAANSGLVTTNYVVVETFAVAQHRQGIEAVRILQQDILPVVDLEWATPEDHGGGVQAVLAARRRDLSLVDAVSFAVMRRLGVTRYLGFDPHFEEQGFTPWQPQP
jgi:predicted nucleic acid-binding protein